jgi:hypothetical protein
MTLIERLQQLANRRENEGSYTDRNICELAIAEIEKLQKDLDHANMWMVPIHEDGNYVFIDGPGDVELDHGGSLRRRAEIAEDKLYKAMLVLKKLILDSQQVAASYITTHKSAALKEAEEFLAIMEK